MILPDVNVLVYAHRQDSAAHQEYLAWLEGTISAPSAYGISELVLSDFLRVVTHPRVFKSPSSITAALEFTNQIRDQQNCVVVTPGNNHWSIFQGLCRAAGTRGNLVADAYHAALAIEHGCEWITTDRDFGRFAGLRWRHPFA